MSTRLSRSSATPSAALSLSNRRLYVAQRIRGGLSGYSLSAGSPPSLRRSLRARRRALSYLVWDGGGATAGGWSKMSDEPLAREREPIERVRARLDALVKANATPSMRFIRVWAAGLDGGQQPAGRISLEWRRCRAHSQRCGRIGRARTGRHSSL